MYLDDRLEYSMRAYLRQGQGDLLGEIKSAALTNRETADIVSFNYTASSTFKVSNLTLLNQ